MTMSCDAAEPLMWGALDDELPADEDSALAGHLASCPACRERFRDRVQLHRRLLERSLADAAGATPRTRAWRRPLAAAAILCICGLLALLAWPAAPPGRLLDGVLVAIRDSQRVRILPGGSLRPGETVEAEGDATVQLDDGGSLRIHAGSRMACDPSGSRLIGGSALYSGTGRSTGPVRLDAACAIRAIGPASYRIESGDGLARLAVLSGELRLEGGPELPILGRGQSLFRAGGRSVVDARRRDDDPATALWSFSSPRTPLRGSCAGVAIDLDLDGAGPAWTPAGIDMSRSGRLLTRAQLPSGLREAMRRAGGCTIETWLRPAPGLARGTRIITLRPSLHLRVQSAEEGPDGTVVRYALRIGGDGDGEGTIALVSPPVAPSHLPTHILAGIDPHGLARLWIDGRLVQERRFARGVADYETMSLSIGDKLDGSTPWRGGIRLIAIHPGMLDEARAGRLFRLGGWWPSADTAVGEQ